jgi:hypothetical protein
MGWLGRRLDAKQKREKTGGLQWRGFLLPASWPSCLLPVGCGRSELGMGRKYGVPTALIKGVCKKRRRTPSFFGKIPNVEPNGQRCTVFSFPLKYTIQSVCSEYTQRYLPAVHAAILLPCASRMRKVLLLVLCCGASLAERSGVFSGLKQRWKHTEKKFLGAVLFLSTSYSNSICISLDCS